MSHERDTLTARLLAMADSIERGGEACCLPADMHDRHECRIACVDTLKAAALAVSPQQEKEKDESLSAPANTLPTGTDRISAESALDVIRTVPPFLHPGYAFRWATPRPYVGEDDGTNTPVVDDGDALRAALSLLGKAQRENAALREALVGLRTNGYDLRWSPCWCGVSVGLGELHADYCQEAAAALGEHQAVDAGATPVEPAQPESAHDSSSSALPLPPQQDDTP